MLLIDGVYLGWLIYATGGVASPLRFFLYMDLIAVSLLASYRTGLKIALWHSLLLFVVFYAQLSGLMVPLEPLVGTAEEAAAQFNSASVFEVSAFWVIAIVTAVFSYLNERELRRRQNDLSALADMSKELKDITEAGTSADVLLKEALRTFGFNRGLVARVRNKEAEVLAVEGDVRTRGRSVMVEDLLATAWNGRDLVTKRDMSPATTVVIDDIMPQARSVVVVPLAAEGQPIGAMVLEVPRLGCRRHPGRGHVGTVRGPLRACAPERVAARGGPEAGRDRPSDRASPTGACSRAPSTERSPARPVPASW